MSTLVEFHDSSQKCSRSANLKETQELRGALRDLQLKSSPPVFGASGSPNSSYVVPFWGVWYGFFGRGLQSSTPNEATYEGLGRVGALPFVCQNIETKI